ncbi:androglobin-like isoform X2 [Gigantopelta aegis]|uniref:androglobin-like isoform X2 n=1 Tax=Gigantopelta aegis TaxID=1735272 RepID=UPI001B8896BC|nr:androglobin-like isoform X2 [Gigantopelta aegis]
MKQRGSICSSPRDKHFKFDLGTMAASIAASVGGQDKRKINIWPEWNDADINAEKWEVARKDDRKGKSPVVVPHYFDDPDGKIEMPSSLKVNHWKRPQEYFLEKTPVIFDLDQLSSGFDLVTNNEHLHESELMRYIISEITALWEMSTVKTPEKTDPSATVMVPVEDNSHTWKPWEHIYALCKAGKGPHMPMYNAHGKYVVRLYWMGCWRKIYVDDSLPFDDDDKMLLPCTTIAEELWPMLLTKALIKIASLDYTGGKNSCEFGDCSIIQCLTGWIPETIPLQYFVCEQLYDRNLFPCPMGTPLVSASGVVLKYFELSAQKNSLYVVVPRKTDDDVRYCHISEIWDLLKTFLPSWQLPVQEPEKTEAADAVKKELTSSVESQKEEKSEKDALTKEAKPEGKEKSKEGGKEKPAKDAKEKEKGKDGKEDKKEKKDKEKSDKDKDKDKHKDKFTEEVSIPENPEVVVFATYNSTPKYPVSVSVLGEHANASEHLRQIGLSHLFPHPLWITQTRDIPLEPPPPPEVIPAWKQIRPRIKKPTPSDEPIVPPDPPKPIKCLEITSPFVNYKVSPIPIPTDTRKPSMALERGSTRSRPNTPSSVTAIVEKDESIPDLEEEEHLSQHEDPHKHDAQVKRDVPPPEIPQDESPVSTKSASSAATKEKKKSTGKKDAKDSVETSPKLDLQSPKIDRRASKSPVKEKSRSVRAESLVSGSKEDDKRDKEKTKEKGDKKDSPVSHKAGPQECSQSEAVLVDDDVEEHKDEEEVVPVEETDTSKPKKIWVDFNHFSICFKTLYIYHKPNTYLCNQKYSDLKDNASSPQNVAPTGVTSTGKTDKKPGTGSSGVNASSLKVPHTPTFTISTSSTLSGTDDRQPHYLFVDSLKSTEIVVSFSSLPRWFDLPQLEQTEKRSHANIKTKEKEIEKETTGLTGSSIMDEEKHDRRGSFSHEPGSSPVKVQPGTVVAEPYSWKSLITGQPVLHLKTTATRAAVLSLPAGRHVLRFMMRSPLAYHIHLCSSTQFVFGDEDTVMAQLTNESCRFRDNAAQVINNLGKCINALASPNPESFQQAWEELVDSHCPYRHDKRLSKQHHFHIFNESLYATLKKSLHDIICPELAFAIRVLLFDASTPNILGIRYSSRPATGSAASQRGSAKLSHKSKQAPTEGEVEKVEQWLNREISTEEHVAAVKIQKAWRGAWVRKIKAARIPGTDENIKVVEQLQKAWAILETNAEETGLYLFREMFKLNEDIMQKYPFYQDEWNKISYADYRGNYPEQSSGAWFVVFREIFYVKDEMLAVPKLYVPISTCLLRVVNNDTGEEIPKVFQKVAPYVYKKNKKGYTFVAEARTTDQPLAAGTWRMRMIGSLSPLPAPKGHEINSAFNAREIRDYYLPNNKNIIFRYSVKVVEDHLASLQVNASKHDVYIKLQILDSEVECISAVGKGHVVIPAYIFHKDYNPDESETKRSSSRSSSRWKPSQPNVAKGKGATSARSDGRSSRSSDRSQQSDDQDEISMKTHKYIIQATVLKNSWPLSESSWTFVQMLKEMEKNELKVAYKERAPSPTKEKQQPATNIKLKGGGKGGKSEKGSKDKDKAGSGSRPGSQQFDFTKPHWTLRVVSDQAAAEDIEVRKDTERADEIRAMKKAWEDAEPGRAAKALQSRLQYLSTHLIKVPAEEEGKEEVSVAVDDVTSETEAQPNAPTPTGISIHDQQDMEPVLTLEPPPQPQKEYLQPFDTTPFIKKTREKYIYLDEEEMQRRLEERQREIHNYKQFRESVERWRVEDKQNRNITKIRQLDKCEELQAALDALRDSINEPREAFRQKYLEAERLRLEELAAQMAALKAEQDAKSPKGRKSAKGKKSPKGKKK